MTKDKALHEYLNRFITSIPITGDFEDVILPYMTYEYNVADSLESTNINCAMWFRSDSEAIPNEKAEEFRKYIADNPLVKCDNGYLFITAGSPFSVSVNDANDSRVKSRQINLRIENLTE